MKKQTESQETAEVPLRLAEDDADDRTAGETAVCEETAMPDQDVLPIPTKGAYKAILERRTAKAAAGITDPELIERIRHRENRMMSPMRTGPLLGKKIVAAAIKEPVSEE